jgi:hypothetical protein
MLMVKKQWFDLIKSGEKTIDYRDCSDFWIKRLVFDVEDPGTENEKIIFTEFDKVIFLCGKETIVKKHVKTELHEHDGEFRIYFS